MTPILADLLQLLELERLEDNIFRGQSRDIRGDEQVFGGQVLGQALTAASYTTGLRQVHSLHAYFLLPGDPNAPIIYEVDVARDGKSFSMRRVVAIQHGRPIFNMAASFQEPEEGFDHAVPMPDVPGPDGLTDVRELPSEFFEKAPKKLRRIVAHVRPFDFRLVEPSQIDPPVQAEPRRHIWIKTVGPLPNSPDLHRNVLAYLSDYYLLITATRPHSVDFKPGNVQLATLDHAMWFHRPFRVDEWLLYAMESPSASGGRGLTLGRFFTQDGKLVATTAQEGVVRVWK
jgi:acyl-CoA thioesterase II